MDLNKINSVLTNIMLLLLGIVCIGTLMALAVPQAALTVAVALFLLGMVTGVNFILTFYLLVQYISSLIKQMDFNYEEQEEENDNQRDSTEGSQESNARDNPNAEANGDNGQKEEGKQISLPYIQTVLPLDMNTINERLIEREKAKLTDGVTTTKGKF